MPGIPVNREIERFETLTANPAAVQRQLLRSILSENADCDYLRQYGVDASDTASFPDRVPVIDYEALRPYMQRIADGDTGSVVTAAPIKALCLSSGTSGAQRKYLPMHDGLLMGTREVSAITAAFRNRKYPFKGPTPKILEFLFCGKLSKTETGGVTVGTVSAQLMTAGAYRQRQAIYGLHPCSPDGVEYGPAREAMYCHLLSGILDADAVEVVSAPFAFTLVQAMATLEEMWPDICADVASGQLSSKITDPRLRAAMAHKLREGTVKELWPNCRYLLSIVTGAMAQYFHKLRHYAGEDLPIVSADYAATEGWIGVNVEPADKSPSDVTFTLLPTLAYFEFIPLRRWSADVSDSDSSDEEAAGGRHVQTAADRRVSDAYIEGVPVGLTEVKVGQDYEVVMTTRWGLYRYRLGDVVRVKGFYNATPQVSYVCRKNVLLSINIDKNTEKDLDMVVNHTTHQLSSMSDNSIELIDYTSYADITTTPGHYVIYLEVANTLKRSRIQRINGDNKVIHENQLYDWFSKCATIMDNAFVEPGYVTSRKMKTIGPLELCIVKRGTFSKLLERSVSQGTSITQYKTPRCIVCPKSISILRRSTNFSFFSSATFE